MAVSIHQLIAAISPDTYCDPTVRPHLKQVVRDTLLTSGSTDYSKAAEIALPVAPNSTPTDSKKTDDPFSFEALSHPLAQRVFTRDAMGESLEAFYFQLLDVFTDDDHWQVTKLVDNFEPSPSSTAHPYFAKRIVDAREQADKLIESSRTLLRSSLREVDDLRAQQDTLGYYHNLKSEDAQRRKIAGTFLKQHWLETVEKRRGSMSLLRLDSQFRDRELIVRFMTEGAGPRTVRGAPTDWLDDTLTQRQEAFERWLNKSETELKKEIALRQLQLRQDLNRLKLQARWLKPLLDQGNPSSSPGGHGAHLTSGFNTMVFTLLILAQGTSSAEERVESGELPKALTDPRTRRYYPVLILEMDFRATRGRLPGIRGKVEVRLTSYGLREDELTILRREVERQELGEAVMAIDTSAQNMVSQLMQLADESTIAPESAGAAPASDDPNPFAALFSLFAQLWHWLQGQSRGAAKHDTHWEKLARGIAITDARRAGELTFESLKVRNSTTAE